MPKILVVEDSADFRLLVSRILENEGYELNLASSVGEALEACKKNEFDLVVLDMTLPDGDGVQMCGELRSNQLSAQRPKILLMTGRMEFAGASGSRQIGADDAISKPFRPHELRQKVRALLSPQSIPDAKLI